MKLETKQELEQLLHEAIEHLKINNAEFVEPISVDTYIENLKILREHYLPDLKTKMSYYSLEIHDKEIESKLMNFINVQFNDYINNEHRVIQPASYGIGNGGSLSGQGVEMLLTKILQIAITSGEQRAIEAFKKSVTESKGSFKQIVLLQGPTTNIEDMHMLTEIQICEGIRFFCLPNVPQKLPPYLFAGGFSSLMNRSHPGIFSLKTIIVIDCEVSPLFIKPDLSVRTEHNDGSVSVSPKEDAYPFQITIKSSKYPDFDVDLFCQAISLTCNFACVPILNWGYIDPDEIYSVMGTGIVPTAKCVLPSNPMGFGRISEEHIPEIKELYERLVKLKKGTQEKLQISIDRWIKSKAEDNPIDKMIDLGIAFESLFVPAKVPGKRRNISFNLKNNASRYLGKDIKNQEKLKKKFKAIYECRCDAVHEGKLDEEVEVKGKTIPMSQFIAEAQDLCQKSIKKILKKGKFPI